MICPFLFFVSDENALKAHFQGFLLPDYEGFGLSTRKDRVATPWDGSRLQKEQAWQGEWGNHISCEHVMLEMPMRYPGGDAKEMTACMRLASVPGVERFGIFQWLDAISTMKQVEITKKMCVSREEAEIKG